MLALLTAALAAPITPAVEPGDLRLHATFASEPHVTAGLGATWAPEPLPVVLTAELTVPAYLLDGRHHRLALGVRKDVDLWRSVDLQLQLAGQQQSTSSDLFAGTTVSLKPTVVTGVYGRRAFVGLETGLDLNLVTWVRPTDHMRDAIWPEASPAVLGPSGGFFVVGLQGGVVLAEKVEIALRAATDTTLAGGSRTAPMDLGLTVGLRL